MKNKFTASLLAFFLGAFGFQWFYLNRAGRGFLYLIFCWTFVPTFLALIEFVWFVSMKEETFNRKFNN